MDTKQIMESLQAPFPEPDIEWRVQRAMKTSNGDKAIVLAYVTNRAIQNRLDDLLGIDGWRNEYKEVHQGILCGISIKINDEWITKWDGADITNIEPTKGGLSNSMKRAAVQWGIGRYLYNLDESWVDIKDKGKYYINDKKSGIKGKWNPPTLPNWALPKQENPKKENPKKNNSQPTDIKEWKVPVTIKTKYELLEYDIAKLQDWYKEKLTHMNQQQIEEMLTKQLQEKKGA